MPAVELGELLRKIDLPSLRSFAGETIIKAIEAVARADREGQIADILRLKYGDEILTEKRIRMSLLDSLSEQQAKEFCALVGVAEGSSHAQSCAALQKYFGTWGVKKSEQFTGFFGLPPELNFRKVLDERPDRELVAAKFGDTRVVRSFLHPYQKRVKDEIVTHSSNPGARFLVQMPTGAGKTYTALEAVVDMFRLPRQESFAVWLVDANELAEQAFDAFRDLWYLKGDKALNLFRVFKTFCSDFREHRGGVVFASFDKLNSILKNRDHKDYQAAWHLVKNTRLLVVDEAHTSVAPTYEECIRAFINADSCVVVGLSATPGRTVAEEVLDLTRLYSTSLIRIVDDENRSITDPVKFLQDRGYLAHLAIEILETGSNPQGTEDQVCTALAKDPERNKKIIEQIKLAAKARQPTLVFACTLDHVFALKILCAASGVDCRIITGATGQSARIDLLNSFRKGEYFVLLNLDLLSTGIDLPNVQKIIITRPVGSPILYSQILGRALRGPLNGGRPENIVLTLKDNLVNFPSANLVYNYFSEEWQNPAHVD